VRKSLAAWLRWHRFSIALAGAASSKLYHQAGGRHGLYGAARRTAKIYTGLFAHGSRLHALAHPVAPSERAAMLIEQAIGEFTDRFLALQRDQLESLPDYNLDTGTVENPVTYSLTIKALKRLGAGPA